MKNIFTLIIFSLFISFSSNAQVNNSSQWTWMNGSNTGNQPAVYGTKGVAAATNTPGSRAGNITWTDASGNFWLFSGTDADDLWKYDPTTNQWTWIKGSNSGPQPGVWGTKGVAADTNTPGKRSGSATCVDGAGNFWLFGGYGRRDNTVNGNGGRKYDPVTDLWTWMHGSDYSSTQVQLGGTYGTKGVAAPTNFPGPRVGSVGWKDAAGNFWLFGGSLYRNPQFTDDEFNDLWKYNTTSNQWTWVSGSNTPNQQGIYGTKGVAAPANVPGARTGTMNWIDISGSFWLFGGGYSPQDRFAAPEWKNDLWKYDPAIDQWTWVSGSNISNQPSNYGTKGISSATNIPGARAYSPRWTDASGNFWLYGGRQLIDSGVKNFTGDDLWRFGKVSASGMPQLRLAAPVYPGPQNNGPTSKLLVVNGNPAIVYFEGGDLKYVRSTDVYGTAWGAPVTIEATGDVGQNFSFQIVNGNPAVSYYDATNSDLKYVRALDVSGTTWGTPVLLDAAGNVGGTNSLQVVNGQPAIGYHDATNKGLKYVRALDASGTTWGTPVTIEMGRVSATGDLQVVNGNPAINYVYPILKDNLNIATVDSSYLKYVRATDAPGTSWGTPARIDASWNYNLRVGSFRVVNGNPAIAYDIDGDITGLKYSRAADASGTLWGVPFIIPTDSYAAVQPSLQIINGNPAIAYYDYYYRQTPGERNDLKYVASADASGTAWDAPVILDATGDVGRNPSLQQVMGSPAISYYDFTNSKIKYIGPAPPATTTTTLSSSMNPSTVGQSVTFTAIVSTASGTPTGTVTFFDGTTSLGTGTLSGNTATFTTSNLTVGSHNITAVYGGNNNYGSSTSAALIQVVTKTITTTSVTSSVNPSIVAQSVTFTATVSTATGTPTGTVTFFDGTINIGTATIAGNTAIFTTSSLTAGSHTITATYNGNATYSSSTSPVLTQVVNVPPPAITTTSLTSSLNPSTAGQSVTFTATVSTASGTPTGTVTFFDGTTNIGSGTLTGNNASFTTSILTIGSHTITTVYNGNANYNNSTSAALTQVIIAPLMVTTTILSSSLNPAPTSRSITFTATVSSVSGIPTGSVTFFDGTTNLGSAILSGNTATFNTSALSAGSHNITAVYNGSPVYSGSTSGVLAQLVIVVGSEKQLHIYPNPVTDGVVYLQMRNMQKGIYEIRLLNHLGQVLLTQQIIATGNGTESVIPGKRIRGVYYLELIKPDNSKTTNKIIIY